MKLKYVACWQFYDVNDIYKIIRENPKLETDHARDSIDELRKDLEKVGISPRGTVVWTCLIEGLNVTLLWPIEAEGFAPIHKNE